MERSGPPCPGGECLSSSTRAQSDPFIGRSGTRVRRLSVRKIAQGSETTARGHSRHAPGRHQPSREFPKNRRACERVEIFSRCRSIGSADLSRCPSSNRPGAICLDLTEFEQAAQGHPADLAALLTWLSRNNLNLLALDFIKTVPPERLADWPVAGALADIKIRLKDWRELERSLKNANWRQLRSVPSRVSCACSARTRSASRFSPRVDGSSKKRHGKRGNNLGVAATR